MPLFQAIFYLHEKWLKTLTKIIWKTYRTFKCFKPLFHCPLLYLFSFFHFFSSLQIFSEKPLQFVPLLTQPTNYKRKIKIEKSVGFFCAYAEPQTVLAGLHGKCFQPMKMIIPGKFYKMGEPLYIIRLHAGFQRWGVVQVNNRLPTSIFFDIKCLTWCNGTTNNNKGI